jgi:hypothetical protein
LIALIGAVGLFRGKKSAGAFVFVVFSFQILCNGLPMFALMVYGWVHAARITTLMSVLTISNMAISITHMNNFVKKAAKEKKRDLPWPVQGILFLFKSLVGNFDKFVIAALLGTPCLHCAFSAGLCRPASLNATVRVACTNSDVVPGAGSIASAVSMGADSLDCPCSQMALR